MAALPRGRAPSLQAGTYGGLPPAAVPNASQVGSQADPLRLGDVVLLFAQDKKSYVFSDISSTVVQSVAVCPVVSPFQQHDPDLPDIHGACFRVLSANKYKAQEHLSQLRQELSLKSKQTLSPQERERMKTAERNVRTENVDNAEEQKRIKGNTVAYGIKIQLQHVYTGKYLCVNSSQTSALESTNLRMELSHENSQNCVFKLLPRYKVRSVGDEVLMNDQVIFESTKTEGQYLHCSKQYLGRTGQQLHSKYHELNLSATESAFTVVPYFCPKEDTEKSDVLTAGSVVRLFHREMECYLVAEGSFADMEEVGVVENVHLRKRRTDRGRLKAPSTSSITYWRIEKQREPLSGEGMHWRELCRIQHLPTRQYLAVVKNQDSYKVTLKERSAGIEFEADTTFRLFPVIEGDDDVNFGSYARIYHVHTESWLHALKESYVKQSTEEVEGLQWDGGDHFRVSSSRQMCYDDAFSLMMVSQDLESKFNFVAGMVPILQAYIAERREPARKLTQKRAVIMEQALSELVEFMCDPYARCKDHQKLVRNLRILELLVSFPKLMEHHKSERDRLLQQQVCRAGYKVIEVFLYGDSRKNELYLSRFIPFFEAQVKVGLNAENILIELVRDNLKTVSTFTMPKIDNIIRLLLEGEKKDCRFFDYLGVLSVCEGKAVVSTQDHILSELVYKHFKGLFFLTKVMPVHEEPGNPMRVFFQDQESGEWRRLTEIAHKTSVQKEDDFSTPWKLLESQLGLFAKLAKGNNTRAIKAITEDLCCVTFAEALAGAGDPGLHPTIRSKYVDLLIVLFVDVGNNHSVLETLAHSFVYAELQENPFEEEEDDIALSLTGEYNQYVAPLRDWLLQVVKDNQVLVCSEESIMQNQLLSEILGLLELLVKYGYYDSPTDIRNIVHPLTAMLDGRTDVPHTRGVPVQADLAKFKESVRFKDSPANRAVFSVKHRIMKIFDFLFNYRVHLRLVSFICEYRTLMSDKDSQGKGTQSQVRQKIDPSAAVSVNIHEPVIWTADTISSPLLDTGKEASRQDAPTVQRKKSPPAQLRELQDEGKIAQKRKHGNLGPITRKHLGDIMKPTAFFEDGEAQARDQPFVQILLDTASYDDADLVVWSMHLLNRFFSSESDVLENAVDTQLLVTDASASSLKTINSQVATFRRITQLELDVSLMAELEEILVKLRRLCVIDEVLREPNCQNQKIILNSGVLNDVLTLILHRLTGSSCVRASSDHQQKGKTEEEQAKEKLSQRAFQFLAAFARGHRPVQEQLFEQMDALLDADYAIQDMALVISEVFTNYHELCVKLKESHVEQVFHLITESEPPDQAALLQALKSMTVTRVESIDLAVKRNQDFVMKYFCRSREFFNSVLGQDASECEKRLHIVTACADDDSRLLLLLSVVDLLAACSKGRNVFVQSICQTILNSDELLQLLCNDKIATSRKLPFCLYLVWVYLDADLMATHTHNTLSLIDPHLFQYVQQTCVLVGSLVRELASIQPRDETIRHLRYTQLGAQGTCARDTVNAEAVGWLAPGVLLYFVDGVLPLLRVYCQQSLDLLSTVEDTGTMQLLRSLATVLLESVQVVQPFLGSAKEAILLRDALLTLTSSPGVDHYLQVSTEVREQVKQFIDSADSAKSTALRLFAEEYSAELQLNTAFNCFVSAYEKAYNGPNTLQHQLGVKDKYLRDEMYSDTEGPGYLPLGPGFQKFVSCFVRRDQSACRVLPPAANLIRQLDVSFTKLEDLTEAEQARQDALDLKCLQVLRAIIYNEIVRIDPELKENQPKKYHQFAAKIVKAQNTIQQLGGNTAAKVIPMLNHPNDRIGAEVLSFLSVFMYDGNKVVQAGCEFLCSRKEGQFLSGIKTRLELSVAISRENRALLAQLLTRQAEIQTLMKIYKGELVGQGQSVTPSHSKQAEVDSEDEDEEQLDGHGMKMKTLLHPLPSADLVESDSAESLAFNDPTHVQLTLQVLGLMCDGQNRNLQNFFRDQPESIANVNLIGEVATFAQHYYGNIRHDNVELVMQVLQTLVEVCVGNYYNQEVVFDCQIVDLLNQVLQMDAVPGCDAGEMLDLKASAVELLEVMLEDTHVDTPKLAKNVLKSLDIEALHGILVYFHQLQSDKEMQRQRKDDDAQRALFKAFHVLKHLCDFEGVAKQRLLPHEPAEDDDEEQQRQREMQDVWQYCSERSKSVEVLYDNLDGDKMLSKVHFRYDPSDQLSEEMVETVKWQVNRESAEDKVRDFLEWMKAIKGIVNHLKTLRDHWYTKVFIYKRNIWHWAYIFLTVVLNILLLVAWKDPADVTPESQMQFTGRSLDINNANNTVRPGFGLPTIPAVELWFGLYLLFILGGLHFLMTLKIVFTYFLVNWPNFYFIPNIFYTIRGKERDGSYADVAFLGAKTLYFLLLLSWSGLSLGFWGYFYPLCLVHIVVNNDILQRVLRSVTKNWRSLFWVAMLGLVVLYIYGLVSYAAYQSYFDDPESGSHCKTLFQCVVSVIRLGLIGGGGLVTNADAAFTDAMLISFFPAYIPRALFDVSFFAIVTTVGLGVIFGIIIDTFSELRDEKYKAEADRKDFCFICNIPAHEFDRKSEGFAHHVACEHNMWDYIYFSLELDRTDTSDQNAIQLFVYNQIQERSPRFFPVLKARCFKHDNDETSIRLARMEDNVQKILDRFENEEKMTAKLQFFRDEQDAWEQARK